MLSRFKFSDHPFYIQYFPAVWYIVKLIGVFSFLYLGTLFIEGCGSSEGIFYFPWIKAHLYYQDLLRDGLLKTADLALRLFGYNTYRHSLYVLRIGQSGIQLNDACLAYGLMSFWIAFCVADQTSIIKKIQWIGLGLFLLNVINVCRICLILLAGYHGWAELPNFDHHSLFNIAAYLLIFTLIFFYSKDIKKVSGSINTL